MGQAPEGAVRGTAFHLFRLAFLRLATFDLNIHFHSFTISPIRAVILFPPAPSVPRSSGGMGRTALRRRCGSRSAFCVQEPAFCVQEPAFCVQILRSAFSCVLRSAAFRILRSAAFCVQLRSAFRILRSAFRILRSAFSCVRVHLRSAFRNLRSAFRMLRSRSAAFAFSCVLRSAAFCQHSPEWHASLASAARLGGRFVVCCTQSPAGKPYVVHKSNYCIDQKAFSG